MAEDDFKKYLAAARVFTPGSPIDRRERFAGRGDELDRIIDAIASPGRHPIIFGQRGVGKTSLANILAEVCKTLAFVRVSCDGADTFESLWNRVLGNASVEFTQSTFGFSQSVETKRIPLAALLDVRPGELKPSDVADALRKVQGKIVIVILDEFDKVADVNAKRLMADVIKSISDDPQCTVTMVIVGVGRDIGQLIGGHPSIERNLVHVEVPKMPDQEIREIIEKGCEELGYGVDEQVLQEIELLADGYPHYAHLLGLGSVKAMIRKDESAIDVEMFQVGCDIAVQDAIERYREAYAVATSTSQASRYPEILCACGYANHDERGVFRASDVVEAMRRVFNQPLTVQAVVPALGAFTSADKGSVLEKVAVGQRSHYRFSDPMMRPFVRVKAQSILVTQ